MTNAQWARKYRDLRLGIGAWALGICWSLGLGHWDFDLDFPSLAGAFPAGCPIEPDAGRLATPARNSHTFNHARTRHMRTLIGIVAITGLLLAGGCSSSKKEAAHASKVRGVNQRQAAEME